MDEIKHRGRRTEMGPIDESVSMGKFPEDATPVEPTIGVVTNCLCLNVRREPNIDAEVLCVVVLDTRLIIDTNNSTDEWYSVCTETGVEGFCMKEYVAI